jgi:hypothetical protein
MVRAIEGDESSIHAKFHKVVSGQLRFLGLGQARSFPYGQSAGAPVPGAFG